MATVIRFARHGTKKKPYFRIVVQDHRSPRNGKFIEHIGAFDPIKGLSSVVVKRDRLEYWLSTGAQMSLSVKNRLRASNHFSTQVGPGRPRGDEASVTSKTKEPGRADKPSDKNA